MKSLIKLFPTLLPTVVSCLEHSCALCSWRVHPVTGPANLLDGAKVLADPDSYDKGAMIVFGSQVHAARHVYKAYTESITAFLSPNNGPIAWIAAGIPRFTAAPLLAGQPSFNIPKVPFPKVRMGGRRQAFQLGLYRVAGCTANGDVRLLRLTRSLGCTALCAALLFGIRCSRFSSTLCFLNSMLFYVGIGWN